MPYPAAAFKLLRQAEGLLHSFIEKLGCESAVPDYTTVSRRSIKLPSIGGAALPEGPLHVLIDSTGLKVFGAGELLADTAALAPRPVQAALGGGRQQRPDRGRRIGRP